MKRLLVIDALNMYFRAYIVDPSLSTNGQPIGGVKGFLKILQKLVRETKPDQIVICWDGAGGSQKRKTLAKGYKEGRKPIRLNRDIRNMTENEEVENKIWQQTRLVELLNEMPIIQLMLPAVEADDIISYVVTSPQYAGWQKVIVSSDKDFFQLCDDETVVFRPIQKEVLNKNAIVEKFNIHPGNFALARAIAGDKSDNLPGVAGVGLATVAKRFPFMKTEQQCTIDALIDHCQAELLSESKLKVFANIIESRDVIELNYKMMQLYSPSISAQGRRKLQYALDNIEWEFNKTGIRAMMIQDGFGEWNWSDLFQHLNKIVFDN
jgi:5'-3' exonuclease